MKQIYFRKKNCAVSGCKAENPGMFFEVMAHAWGWEFIRPKNMKDDQVLIPATERGQWAKMKIAACEEIKHQNLVYEYLEKKGFLEITRTPVEGSHLPIS